MSHVTAYDTEIRSLEHAARAAEALEIEVLSDEYREVFSYYKQELPDGTRSRRVPVDLVLGCAGFGVGLRLNPATGNYAVLCDVFDANKEMLAKFGPTFHEWTWGVPFEGAQPGHIPTGRPTALLQQYAIEVAVDAATREGFAIDALRDPETGDVVLKLTGGPLLPGQYAEFTAYADGSSGVAVYGVEGGACVELTRFLDDAIGGTSAQTLTQDFYHDRAGNHIKAQQRR